MEIWVVRHGQTTDNAKRILQGHQDGKLSELGIMQAKLVGERLSNEPFNYVFVSDLGRTKETFSYIQAASKTLNTPGVAISFSGLLREKGAGIYEGQPLGLWVEKAKELGVPIRKYKCDKGESWEDVHARAQKFIQLLIDDILRKPRPEEKPDTLPRPELPMKPIEEVKLDPKTRKVDLPEEEKKVARPVKASGPLKTAGPTAKAIRSASKPVAVKPKEIALSVAGFVRILVVSHGGYIMELLNVISLWKDKKEPVLNNVAFNCAIYVIAIFCRRTGRFCGAVCKDNACIDFTILRKNDDSHLKAIK